MAGLKQTLYQKIVNRWSEHDTVYNQLRKARVNITNFFRPDLGVTINPDNDMLMLGGDICEGTGPWVARIAAVSHQGNSVSKKLDWFQYKFSDDRLIGIDELDQFSQDMKEHQTSVYQDGNFYDIQPQFTLDGWTIGSPLYFIEEDELTNRVMCIPLHWSTYRIFYDRFNQSEGVMVNDSQWSAKKCFDKFCPVQPGQSYEARLEKAKKLFSQALTNSIIQGNLNDRYKIWRAVFKADDPIWETEGFTPPVSTRNKPKTWYDVYFEDEGSQSSHNQEPLLVTGYFSKPFVHWDYDKKSWESASRTPAFEAIYDDMTLLQIFKNWIDNTQMKARPAIMSLLEMKPRLDFRPGGVTYVKKDEWDKKPTIIENIGDVRWEKDTIDDLRKSLGRHFHHELWRMFTDLAYQKNQEFRVIQLTEMAGERITQLLPMMETHEGYLRQADDRVRSIEINAGRGPFNRQNLENIFDIISHHIGPLEADQVRIKPEFIGTLRKTQRRQQQLQPINFGVSVLGEIAKQMDDPNLVRFALKKFEVSEAALRAVDFPEKLINEKSVFEKSYEDYYQGQAEQAEFEKQLEVAKVTEGAEV